jgi:hypothetical protein
MLLLKQELGDSRSDDALKGRVSIPVFYVFFILKPIIAYTE